MPSLRLRPTRFRPTQFHPILSRDKSDTLLLIFACVCVLLPHTAHITWWVSAASALLLTWRGWLTLNGKRLPPALLLLPIALLMMGGVFLTHKTFFGREAGVTMLVLLLTCKLLEMHAKRDLFVVIFLGFFLLLTSFFYQQTIGTALITMLALCLLLTAQLSFHYTGVIPPLKQRLKLGASILGLAIPVTIIAFLLFPRIQGPLWGLPGDAQSGRTGLSGSMAPGNISELVLSEDIAFRVRFNQAVPQKSLLYWRGVVMTDFDGRTWSQDEKAGPVSKHHAVFSGNKIRQEIILEPNGQNWMFALDVAAGQPQIEGAPITSSLVNARMEIRNARNISQRLRYEVESYPVYKLETNADQNTLLAALDLPEGYNPRTMAFANKLRASYQDNQQLIGAVLNHFRREAFSYTLEPSRLGLHSVDEFLFDTKAGFCEHYSSAFVILMRAAKIPARVVTGYQGGAMNTVDDYFEIRQSDAHAWAEVWLEGQGWVRVDPTAAVAPERVMQSLNYAVPRRGLAGLVNLGPTGISLLNVARMQWDAINNSWNQWVLNYNQGSQRNLLNSLGFLDVDWAQITLLFFIVASLVIGLMALPLMRNQQRTSALDKVYFSFCRKMARKTAAREMHEGPQAYLQRLRTVLPATEVTSVERFLLLYAATRYGKISEPETLVVRRLKTLLAECR
ncbi:transglutaminase TgpA family protein [Undibacterium sp. Ji50W]|uniref:transglutaminase TgpA family protein n=1 Tax=Undibacterium sp. Ji50W TaxID=3413041 RepID=UPI003BF2AD34